MKKALCLIICLFAFSNIHALELNSKNIILYNLNDDKIIYELNAYEKTSIASLTKIMTVLVALDYIDDIDSTVTITNDMIYDLKILNASSIGFEVGTVVTYRDLLYATILPSAADAARTLALSIKPTEAEYVSLMNEKAKNLGLSNTHFANVIGLDDPDNYSTVYEVSLILKEALKNDLFKTVFETRKYVLSNGMLAVSSMQKTADEFNFDTSKILGAKTGYTNIAGKCLASIAYDEKNDIKYLLVTTGASILRIHAFHILDAIKLYDYYFENYKYHTLIDKNEIIKIINIKYSKNKIEVRLDDDLKYFTDNVDKTLLKIDYDGLDKIEPNTKVGSILGTIYITYNDEEILNYDVILNQKINFSLYEYLKLHVYEFIAIILLILSLSTYLILKKRNSKVVGI